MEPMFLGNLERMDRAGPHAELIKTARAMRRSCAIRQEDVDRVKRAGWSDEAFHDAITVCSLFNFYNRWCDAAGVHDMPPKAYEASGKRLAQHGYAVG